MGLGAEGRAWQSLWGVAVARCTEVGEVEGPMRGAEYGYRLECCPLGSGGHGSFSIGKWHDPIYKL